MGEQAGQVGTTSIRSSFAEREATADRLTAAQAEGRISADELFERLHRITDTSTQADLRALVADLPQTGTATTAPVAAGSPAPESVVRIIGSYARNGAWSVPSDLSIVTGIGSIDLDMSAAIFTSTVTTLRLVSVLGGVTITVPRGMRVEAGGVQVLGGQDAKGVPEGPSDGRTLVITGFRLVGGLTIILRLSRSRGGPSRASGSRTIGVLGQHVAFRERGRSPRGSVARPLPPGAPVTDHTPSPAAAPTSTSAVGGRAYFAWHPVYQGRDVESVRRDITDELRRDQRAYDLALQAAEQNESASLQSIITLDSRWSPFDLGWTEADPTELAAYVLAVELERDRQQRMASPKELQAAVTPPAIAHAGPSAGASAGDGDVGFPISRRWQVIVSVLVVLGLIALLVVQVF